MLKIISRTPVIFSLLIGMALVAVACGGGGEPIATSQPAPTSPAAQTAVPTSTASAVVASPTPSSGEVTGPKRGGRLILAAHGPPAHFDFYGSGTVANVGAQGSMYNQLIRFDPTDSSLPIINDLATGWEISADGLRYTFRLHEGVEFHDGSTLTAEDVEASYRRIIFPEDYDPALVSSRKAVFEGVQEINVIDPLTVEFVLKGPRNPTMMTEAFALQWNLITKKSVLEANAGNLRELDDNPGTGPFMHSSRTDDRWIQTANPNYWNAGNGPNGCPCVDSLEHIWLVAWTPELAAAIRGGVVDWAMWLDPATGRTIGERDGINGVIQSIPVVAGIGWNHASEPYDDVRVRRALALTIDGQALVRVAQDVKGHNFGEWFINGTPFAMDPAELLQLPGFRVPTEEDYEEARSLLSEAGYPNGEGFPRIDLLTRDTPDARLKLAAVQSMLQEHLNLDSDIRIADVSGIADDQNSGNFDVTDAGYGIILTDPSAYVGQGFGPDNNLNYHNPQVESLIEQLAAEPDQARRIDIAGQMRDIFLEEWPLMPYSAGESVFWGYWDHVKGLVDGSFTGSYEMHRWDNVWLER